MQSRLSHIKGVYMENQLLRPNITNRIIYRINNLSTLTNLIPNERRTRSVSVQLNNAELSKLNNLRGNAPKGEWLRMTFLQKLPHDCPTCKH